ncbi:MAG: hypothetical protein WD077_04035 [Bacteroidia bacterium]
MKRLKKYLGTAAGAMALLATMPSLTAQIYNNPQWNEPVLLASGEPVKKESSKPGDSIELDLALINELQMLTAENADSVTPKKATAASEKIEKPEVVPDHQCRQKK